MKVNMNGNILHILSIRTSGVLIIVGKIHVLKKIKDKVILMQFICNVIIFLLKAYMFFVILQTNIFQHILSSVHGQVQAIFTNIRWKIKYKKRKKQKFLLALLFKAIVDKKTVTHFIYLLELLCHFARSLILLIWCHYVIMISSNNISALSSEHVNTE